MKQQEETKPVFLYGTLRALPLLTWALTGDASQHQRSLSSPPTSQSPRYARLSLHNRDYPAVIEQCGSSVDGCIIILNKSQRKKLDDFEGEGEAYKAIPVTAVLDNGDKIEAEMYLWNGAADDVSTQPWELKTFIDERLGDWIDLFDGMELVGADSESED